MVVVSREESRPFSRRFLKSNLHYPADRYLCLELGHLVFLGDSQMYHLTRSFSKIMGNCTLIKSGSRCGETNGYLGIEALSSDGEFVHPGQSEGPVAHGLQNLGSGCRDCAGCDAMLFKCRDGSHEMMIEYIAIEFARDVSLQSSLYKTTQENVGYYLSKHNVSHIVYNTGLHDTSLEDASSQSYRDNLVWYNDVLRKFMPFASYLWVDTVAVVKEMQPERWRNVTMNELIADYNRIASRISDQFGYQRISPFGLLQLPYFSQLNSDGVHYMESSGVFYDMLATEIILKLCR